MLARIIRLVGGLRDVTTMPLDCLIAVVFSLGKSSGVTGLSGLVTLYTGRAR